MRIIAGKAKGRVLLPPDGMQTRPTLDRVKESIFSIIQGYIPEAVVVDVFAGTGSLGLEAVSRGAKECYLVDKHPSTFQILKKNVANLNFTEQCNCLNLDAYQALEELARRGITFDIIFIDPPYAKVMIPPAVERVEKLGLLKSDGIIVTKIDSSESIYDGYGTIKRSDCRKYGNTTVCMYQYQVTGETDL